MAANRAALRSWVADWLTADPPAALGVLPVEFAGSAEGIARKLLQVRSRLVSTLSISPISVRLLALNSGYLLFSTRLCSLSQHFELLTSLDRSAWLAAGQGRHTLSRGGQRRR